MDNQARIRLLLNTRATCMPVFILLGAWILLALLGDPYSLRRQPGGARPHVATDIVYKLNPPLEECLSAIRSREMFKPSVIYTTNKDEVTNVLGDLVFLGVVRNGASIQALIQNKKTGVSSFYAPGQALEELEIQGIQDDKVVFKHGEETLNLVRY